MLFYGLHRFWYVVHNNKTVLIPDNMYLSECECVSVSVLLGYTCLILGYLHNIARIWCLLKCNKLMHLSHKIIWFVWSCWQIFKFNKVWNRDVLLSGLHRYWYKNYKAAKATGKRIDNEFSSKIKNAIRPPSENHDSIPPDMQLCMLADRWTNILTMHVSYRPQHNL